MSFLCIILSLDLVFIRNQCQTKQQQRQTKEAKNLPIFRLLFQRSLKQLLSYTQIDKSLYLYNKKFKKGPPLLFFRHYFFYIPFIIWDFKSVYNYSLRQIPVNSFSQIL